MLTFLTGILTDIFLESYLKAFSVKTTDLATEHGETYIFIYFLLPGGKYYWYHLKK